MTLTVRIILMIFGWLVWGFWMFMAYKMNFLGMVSSGKEDEYYRLRVFFKVIPIRKTERSKKAFLFSFILFGMVIIAVFCFFAG